MLTLVCLLYVVFFKQKTAYEMRISDWSSDGCSSDLGSPGAEECDHVIGTLGVRGPDLATIQAPTAVDARGPRSDRGKVRPRVRPAHADTERDVAASHARPQLALLVISHAQQQRTALPVSDPVGGIGRASGRERGGQNG